MTSSPPPLPTRRTLLRVAGAAASALALPVAAGAGPAWAGRRPPVGGPQTVTIGTRAGFFTGLSGPIPDGIRLSLGLTGTNGGGVVYPQKLSVPNLGELTTFNPGALPIRDRATATVPLDIGPVTPGQLPTRFEVQLSYLYVVDGNQFMNEVRQTVTLVPLVALGRQLGALPPGSLALGPHATVSGNRLTLSVTAVGPSTGAAFGLQYFSVRGGPTTTTFDPSLLSPAGSQVFAVTTSPLTLSGSFTVQLAGVYDTGGDRLQPVASQATRITVVPPQAFRLRPPLPR